jgi:hypothetical protein
VARIDSNAGASMPFVSNNIVNTTGVLEVYYGDGTQPTEFSLVVSNVGCYFSYLEYYKFPSDMTYNTSASIFANVFSGSAGAVCQNLSKVVMPVTMGTSQIVQLNSTFSACYNLLEITLPATVIFNTLDSAFLNCRNLQTITFPTNSDAFNSCTSLSSAFSNCNLLTTLVNFPSALPAITTIASMFNNCYSLNNIAIPKLGAAGGTVVANNVFSNCSGLRNVTWAGDYTTASAKLDAASSMFSSCVNLILFRFIEGVDLGNCTSMFSACTNLKSVIFPSTATSISNMQSTFSGCSGLQECIFPPTISTAVSFNSTFSNCFLLESVTLPQGGTISNLTSCFTNCFNLKSITFPSSLVNCTTISGVFSSCYSLQEVTFPTNLSLCNSMANAFSGCTSLHTVTLPTNLNALTTLSSAFNGCTSLSGTITFPALPALTTLFQAFLSCRSLKSVVFSTINAAVSNWSNAFSGCNSLVNVTLPSTQMTGIISSNPGINNLFQNCASLSTVTNMDKLGSTANTQTLDASSTNFTFSGIYQLQSITLSPRLQRFSCNGFVNNLTINKVASVRFLATAPNQWSSGTAPQVDISYTSMGTAAIVTMFNDMAAQGTVTSKTVNITGAVGAAGLSAADRLIVTSRGWTITG